VMNCHKLQRSLRVNLRTAFYLDCNHVISLLFLILHLQKHLASMFLAPFLDFRQIPYIQFAK